MSVKQTTSENLIVLDVSNFERLDDEQFFKFCVRNRELRIERAGNGDIIVMLPVGSEGGTKENTLSFLVTSWNRQYKLGKVFSPSTGFTLANGAIRSADVAYITIERWKLIPLLKRKKFAPICPDFVAEMRSESDNIANVRLKMEEWQRNGLKLGWLIDPIEEKAYVYRPNQDPDIINGFDNTLYGENVLPNFELDLTELREQD